MTFCLKHFVLKNKSELWDVNSVINLQFRLYTTSLLWYELAFEKKSLWECNIQSEFLHLTNCDFLSHNSDCFLTDASFCFTIQTFLFRILSLHFTVLRKKKRKKYVILMFPKYTVNRIPRKKSELLDKKLQFISHNSDSDLTIFFLELWVYISQYWFISHNFEFISRSSEFISHNSEKKNKNNRIVRKS